jgi:hypothetical protein
VFNQFSSEMDAIKSGKFYADDFSLVSRLCRFFTSSVSSRRMGRMSDEARDVLA